MSIHKISPKKFLFGIIILVLAGIIVWGVHLAYRVIHLNETAHQLMSALQSEKIDSAALTPDLTSIGDDLNAIQSNIRPLYPFLSAGSGLPGIGPYLGQAAPLLNFSNGLIRAGNLLIKVFEPVLKPSIQAAGSQTTTEKLFSAIESNLGLLDEASGILDQIAPERQKIDPSVLPSSLRNYYLKLDQYFPILQQSLPALKQIPLLMGSDSKQNYLVLAQNHDEIRATGGFISGIGMATLQKGKVISFTIGDSYTVDDFSKGYPSPPAPLKQFMLADYWVTSDANWSPDFPTSARQTQKLFTLSTGIAVNGTIAFDQQAVVGLLQALGPVTLEGYPDPISASNVEEFMHIAWEPDPQKGVDPQWWANRKNFMGQLGKVILARLYSLGDQKLMVQTALTLLDLMKSGHLLVYVEQPQIADLLATAHLDGALNPTTAGFVYLVDSNVGFNKVDSVINRTLTYELDLTDPKAPTAQITAQYTHTGQQAVVCKQEASYGKGTYADLQARCYWDYWRIYLPTGSQLLESSVLPVSGSQLLNGKDWPGQVAMNPGEANLVVASGLLVLPPTSQQQIQFKIALPASVVTKDENQQTGFNLQILKQPGLDKLPVTVKIKLPSNTTIQPGLTDWQKGNDGAWNWSGILTEAREVSISFCCIP